MASVVALFLQEIAEQSLKTRVLSVIVVDPHELIETTLGQLLAVANVRAFTRSIKEFVELGLRASMWRFVRRFILRHYLTVLNHQLKL